MREKLEKLLSGYVEKSGGGKLLLHSLVDEILQIIQEDEEKPIQKIKDNMESKTDGNI